MKFSSLLTAVVAVAAIIVVFQPAEAHCGRCCFGVVSCNAGCNVVVGTACEAGVCQTACDSATIQTPTEKQKPTPAKPKKTKKVEPEKKEDTAGKPAGDEEVNITPVGAANSPEEAGAKEASESVKEMVENGTKD